MWMGCVLMLGWVYCGAGDGDGDGEGEAGLID